MRGGNYLPALEMIDWQEWQKELVEWAETADLSRPGDDGMGHAARERLAKWEAAGDEKAAIEALEACVRKLRMTFEAHTWAEPINDRIWAPDHPLIVMAQGEMSHERNQTWPRHYVSYSGLTDFAAWVRKKSNTSLRVWVYSFAEQTGRRVGPRVADALGQLSRAIRSRRERRRAGRLRGRVDHDPASFRRHPLARSPATVVHPGDRPRPDERRRISGSGLIWACPRTT